MLYAELSAAKHNLVHAQQAERDRIARELHDTLLQATQALILQFHAAVAQMRDGEPTRALLHDALDRADQVVAEARDRVTDLRIPPDTLERLPEALKAVGEDLFTGLSIDCRIVVQGQQRELTRQVNDEAYRIGREALLNAYRHACGNVVEVEIFYADDILRMRVRDNGVGIGEASLQSDAARGHWGIRGMRERASEIGARLEVRTRAGDGTEIELIVPAALAYADIPVSTRSLPFRRLARDAS